LKIKEELFGLVAGVDWFEVDGAVMIVTGVWSDNDAGDDDNDVSEDKCDGEVDSIFSFSKDLLDFSLTVEFGVSELTMTGGTLVSRSLKLVSQESSLIPLV